MNRFEIALQVITERLLAEFGDDLVGLLFAGSAAYGTPMRNSDIDLYVLIRPRWRQRRNEVIEGVEVEMFVNPVEQIRSEIEDRQAATVDMFARGRICHDPEGTIGELIAAAREAAALPPVPPTKTELYFIRYRPSDLLRDAEDLVEEDEIAAELVVTAALHTTIEAYWLIRGLPVPKAKRVLARLREEAPEAADVAEAILHGDLNQRERVEHLRHLCDLVLEPVGGVLLEGSTPPEPVS